MCNSRWHAIVQHSLARLINSHWDDSSIVAGTIHQQSLAQLFDSHWRDCSTVTGTIVQQSLARLFNSHGQNFFFFLYWQNSSTVMFTVEESSHVPRIRHMILFFQCVTYLLLILNSNMNWLKYNRCKIRTQQNVSFRGLLASLSSRNVFFLWTLRTILYHCYMSLWLVFRCFQRSWRNVFLRIETRPVIYLGHYKCNRSKWPSVKKQQFVLNCTNFVVHVIRNYKNKTNRKAEKFWNSYFNMCSLWNRNMICEVF